MTNTRYFGVVLQGSVKCEIIGPSSPRPLCTWAMNKVVNFSHASSQSVAGVALLRASPAQSLSNHGVGMLLLDGPISSISIPRAGIPPDWGFRSRRDSNAI